MSESTLVQIKKKVRRLTGSPSTNQLTDADLEEYIDTFFEQDMPSQLKLWNLHETYEFWTVANQDTYAIPANTFQMVKPPIYVDGYQCFYTQSREEFYRIYPLTNFQQTLEYGTGIAGPYTQPLSNLPALPGEVTISAIDTTGATQTVEDRPNNEENPSGLPTEGKLFDVNTDFAAASQRGTINYVTGAISLTFAAAIPSTQPIIARYRPYQASRPAAALYFNTSMILRPVPDRVYKVSMEVYRKPSQLLSANSHDGANVPDLNQWWQYIAFGAAMKVLEDRQDMEGWNNLMPGFLRQEKLVLNRTAAQLSNQRVATIYTDQLQYPVGSRGYFNGV